MKKLIISFLVSVLNRFDLLQRISVDVVMEGPAWLGQIVHDILDRCDPGMEYLEDRQIARGHHRYIRMQEGARLLNMHGLKPRIDYDPPRIWIGEDTIDCVWDSMNGEPELHPRHHALPRNVDALVVRDDVFKLILARGVSKGSIGKE